MKNSILYSKVFMCVLCWCVLLLVSCSQKGNDQIDIIDDDVKQIIFDIRKVHDKQSSYDDSIINNSELSGLENYMHILGITDTSCVYRYGKAFYKYDFSGNTSTQIGYVDAPFLNQSQFPIANNKLYFGGLFFYEEIGIYDNLTEERESVIYEIDLKTNDFREIYRNPDDVFLSQYYDVLDNGYVVFQKNQDSGESIVAIDPIDGSVRYATKEYLRTGNELIYVFCVSDNKVYTIIESSDQIGNKTGYLNIYDDKLNYIKTYNFSDVPKEFLSFSASRMEVYKDIIYWYDFSGYCHIWQISGDSIRPIYENDSILYPLYCNNYDDTVTGPVFYAPTENYIMFFDDSDKLQKAILDTSGLPEDGYQVHSVFASKNYYLVELFKFPDTPGEQPPIYFFLVKKDEIANITFEPMT